ncbi:MAG: VanZ family protein [Halalkalicoccus sp.]
MRAGGRWAAVGLVAGAILLVSVIPIPGSVPKDGGVPTSALFHVVGYAVLAALLSIALLATETRVRAALLGSGGASGYGALIECVQYPISYRTFNFLDMLINGAGAGVGVLLLFVALALREAP